MGKRIVKSVHVIEIEKAAGEGGEASKQLPADPFSSMYDGKGLVKPPYDLDMLLALKEMNAIHAACIGAKVADIAGAGYDFDAVEGLKQDDDELAMLKNFFLLANLDTTTTELLRAVWDDYETLGWGLIEVTRNIKGQPSRLYHIPGHTVRAHKDGIRFAQFRDEKYRWFKRFGHAEDFMLEDGRPAGNGAAAADLAGEVIVFRKQNSRSSFYGIPEYVSAMATLAGSKAVSDYNRDFFSGKTIPDALLILEGADEVEPQVEASIKAFFEAGKGKHHKVAMLPLPQGVTGKLEKLTPEVKEAGFRLYRQDNAIEICSIHRVPPYRIGWPVTGSMGGNMADEMNDMYKRSVIEPGQEILEHRINSILLPALKNESSKGGTQLTWRWKLNEIDPDDGTGKLDYEIKAVHGGLKTRNQGRQGIGFEPDPNDPLGDVYFMPNTHHPLTGNQEQPNAPGSGQELPQGGVQPVQKADESEEEQMWADWAVLHHSCEIVIQKDVASFFGGRGNG